MKPDKAGGVWAPISASDFKALESATETPVKITFNFKYADGYIPPEDDTQFVYGVKLSPSRLRTFRRAVPTFSEIRPMRSSIPSVTMGFVVFSSICPHLGCRYAWNGDAKRFICPCHGSEFSSSASTWPAPRRAGSIRFRLREPNGIAQVTWIQYKSVEPDRSSSPTARACGESGT